MVFHYIIEVISRNVLFRHQQNIFTLSVWRYICLKKTRSCFDHSFWLDYGFFESFSKIILFNYFFARLTICALASLPLGCSMMTVGLYSLLSSNKEETKLSITSQNNTHLDEVVSIFVNLTPGSVPLINFRYFLSVHYVSRSFFKKKSELKVKNVYI